MIILCRRKQLLHYCSIFRLLSIKQLSDRLWLFYSLDKKKTKIDFIKTRTNCLRNSNGELQTDKHKNCSQTFLYYINFPESFIVNQRSNCFATGRMGFRTDIMNYRNSFVLHIHLMSVCSVQIQCQIGFNKII